ncbi:cell wall metabolism sensor histidine kinase WalK [Candidatus Woesearchaeota archaeon]|nr:cell wall metabolism sensor histidine kinase WalK [Candidatus Woesearchaeota archaeon]
MTFADLLHGFFNFLGFTEGALLKTAIELLLFTVVTYMITSEWTRSRQKELRFLIIAFGAMALNKLVAVYFLASVVFTKAPAEFWMLHTFDNFLEIFALFLVANAFVYPIIKQRGLKFKIFMRDHLLLLIAVSFVFSLFVLSIIDLTGGSLQDFWTNTSINVAEVVVLLYYAGFILVNSRYRLKYRNNIVIAFIVYTIAPTLELFNIILYDNAYKSLAVAAHPFPFISVMLFTRVIYLKLADKANILDRLRKSEALYAREKEISKLKDNFISTVSHELKTPLTSMKLYVHLLKDKKLGPVTPKQKGSLKIIDAEVDRLNILITDILDLSKLDAKKVKLNLSEFELGDIIANDLYLNLAKKKNVNIKLDIPKRFTVTADRDRLQQVFINLFNNSLKFTPEGGTIKFSAKDLEKEWLFSIADNGAGIPKDALPKLFDRFTQAEDVMTRKQGGFGLGLSIVKSIVDLHKGKISIDSEQGNGTTISICFPKLTRY